MTGGEGCPCGLRPACPYGQDPSQPLNCPIWEAHVKPSFWERITGFIVAIFMGRR